MTQEQIDAALNNYGINIIAWGRTNGPALLEGQNIASVTQDGTDNYRKRVRFTTAPPDANYAIIATINGSDDQYQFISAHPNSNEQFTIVTRDSDGTPRERDSSFVVLSMSSTNPPFVRSTDASASRLAELEERIAQLEANQSGGT